MQRHDAELVRHSLRHMHTSKDTHVNVYYIKHISKCEDAHNSFLLQIKTTTLTYCVIFALIPVII